MYITAGNSNKIQSSQNSDTVHHTNTKQKENKFSKNIAFKGTKLNKDNFESEDNKQIQDNYDEVYKECSKVNESVRDNNGYGVDENEDGGKNNGGGREANTDGRDVNGDDRNVEVDGEKNYEDSFESDHEDEDNDDNDDNEDNRVGGEENCGNLFDDFDTDSIEAMIREENGMVLTACMYTQI